MNTTIVSETEREIERDRGREGERKRQRGERELAFFLSFEAITTDGPLRTSEQDLQALASQPMQQVLDLGHIAREVPQNLPTGDLPFDIAGHPAVRHTVAKRLLDRMQAEMKRFAEMQKDP